MKSAITKNIFAASLLLCSGAAMGQTLNAAYFTNDYKFRHTMNPAYGNEQSYMSMPVLGNINVKLDGNFGYGDLVFDNPDYGRVDGAKQLATFMHPGISVDDALGGLSKGNNRIVGGVNLTILSWGFKGFGGYNTFEINSKTNFGASLPYDLFAFAKNTGNNRYDIGDLALTAQSYVELAFGHSHDINENLRIGAKLKLLFGAARADVQFKDLTADLTQDDKWTISGTAQADVSMKGFKYETETKKYESKPGTYQKITGGDVDGAGLGGFGLAADLGAVYKFDNDWTFSASLLDLGYIKWSENAQAVNGADQFVFNGFRDMSVKDGQGAGTSFDDQADSYGDQLTDFANLKESGKSGGRTTGIGATINLGAEYNLPVYRRMTFGFLSSTRLQGKFTWSEGRLSANWNPLKWIDGGVNVAVSSFGTSAGWVLNIHPKGINLYVGMDHILGKLTKEGIPLSSKANIALGMSFTW